MLLILTRITSVEGLTSECQLTFCPIGQKLRDKISPDFNLSNTRCNVRSINIVEKNCLNVFKSLSLKDQLLGDIYKQHKNIFKVKGVVSGLESEAETTVPKMSGFIVRGGWVGRCVWMCVCVWGGCIHSIHCKDPKMKMMSYESARWYRTEQTLRICVWKTAIDIRLCLKG